MLKRLALGAGITLIAMVGFAPAAGATAIPVTTALDSFGIDNSTCSLREAVESINTNSGFSGCTAPDPFGSNTIDVVAGTTYQLNLTGSEPTVNNNLNDLDVLAPVQIRSIGGTGGTTIVAPTGDRVIQMGTGVTSLAIDGIRIRGGSTSGTGGGISDDVSGASLIVTNSTVDGNHAAGNGGGIYSGTGTTLSLANVTASGNTTDADGGNLAYNSSNTTFIKNSTIVDSTIEGNGAGIANLSSGIVNISNTILAGNNSGGEPSECSGTITSGNNNVIGTTNFCTITQPIGNGTDIIGATPGAEVPANLGALADNGGRVFTRVPTRMSPAINRGYISGAGTTCEATDARGTTRPREGRCDIGAVEVAAAPQTYAATTTADQLDASPVFSGGCSLREAVTASNNNQATGGCPAGSTATDTIQLAPGTFTLTRAGVDDTNVNGDLDLLSPDTLNIVATGGGQTTIDGNGTTTNDRVLQASSSVFGFINGVNIRNGRATGNGGGVETAGELDLNNVTVSGNFATGDGGGVHYTNTSSGQDIENSTVSGNQANGNGGGMTSADGFWPRVHDVTVTGNTADANTSGADGGGGLSGFVGFQLSNTIVAGNVDASGGDAPDCNTGVGHTTLGYNLIGNANNCNLTPATGDQVGTSGAPISAGLNGLANNGGTTLTHAPVFGSAVLNTGNPAAPGVAPACLPIDQIGTVRPLAGRCDIGALETNPAPPVVPGTNTPVNPPAATTPPATATGLRAAALKKCKKKKTATARKKCKKKAKLLPI